MEPDNFSSLPWQLPNATEATAAEQMREASNYLAFPWATWIDRFHRNQAVCPTPRAKSKPSGICITVCQHIWALNHLELFQQAGVTDLFWSHATKGLQQIKGIRIHPFPLYPIRCATHPPINPLKPSIERSFLYCFQGAYDSELYLTEVRNWLLELETSPKTKLDRRREWHFEQKVYREQIEGKTADQAHQYQLNQEAESYAKTLQNSCFALCPSGSGPNSIRLWEALGYGSIPVILSDNLELPGPRELWEAAAIFIPETKEAVAALPRQLELLALDHQRLQSMQQATKKLWNRYGLTNLNHDINEFLQDPLGKLTSQKLQAIPKTTSVIRATHPALLPLIARRKLQNTGQSQALLIEIDDDGPHEILMMRWQAAIKICKKVWPGRPIIVISLLQAINNRFNNSSP